MEEYNQIPSEYGPSAATRLDAVENALFCIRDAMEWLKECGNDYEDACNTLDDLQEELEAEQRQLEIDAAGEHNEMIAELTREYYRSVL